MQRDTHFTQDDSRGTRETVLVNYGRLSRGERRVAEQLSEMLDFADSEVGGIIITAAKIDEAGLLVSRKGQGIHLEYSSWSSFTRALSHVREVWQTGRPVNESPQFQDRGFMLDCSRNSVSTVSTIKNILQYMALLGLNNLFLYTEDTYQLPSYPYFGYQRGAYTAAELREIDDYGALLGIEVIPCIQTLAHLTTFLQWDDSAALRDSGDVLLVGDEEVYTLIAEMFRTLRKTFRTSRIHIGMDEAHDLGRGRSLDRRGYIPPASLMKEHLERVNALAKAAGYNPIMWSDMYFRMASPDHEYYDDAPLTQEIRDSVVPDVGLVYWDYYHEDQATYDRMLTRHESLGPSEIWFASGVWTWNGLKVNHGKALATNEAGLAACRKHNIQHVFTTAWGDNGAETNVVEAFLDLQYFGDASWTAAPPAHDSSRRDGGRRDGSRLDGGRQDVIRRSALLSGADSEAFYAMRLFDEVPGVAKDNPLTVNPSKYILWCDPLTGLFDALILPMADQLAEHYLALAEYFDSVAGQSRSQARVFYLQSAQLADCLQRKVHLIQELRPAYLNEDFETLNRLVKTDIPELIAAVTDLQAFTLSIWYLYYKPEGSEVIDARFGAQLARLRTCQDRLDGFLTNVYDQLPELENERLPYDGRSSEEVRKSPHIRVNLWQRIISANPI